MSARNDFYAYRALRRIYLNQREFWSVNDRTLTLQEHRQQARRDRIRRLLGNRAKYAPSLVNGSRRYNQYGELI